MKRALVVLLFCLLPLASAREGIYLGLRFSAATARYASVQAFFPLPGLQLGIPLTEELDVRASLETIIFTTIASVDLLYTQELAENVRWYTGAGPEVSTRLETFREFETSFGAHLIAGVEARSGLVSFFGEAQPVIDFSTAQVSGKFVAGINLHF